jgi:putative sigma-54 modulation protein
MQTTVKGRHAEITDELRDYAAVKMAKCAKQLPEAIRLEVELKKEKHQYVACATVFTKRQPLRLHADGRSFQAAIDLLADKLERQVRRYREKRSPQRVRLNDLEPKFSPQPPAP